MRKLLCIFTAVAIILGLIPQISALDVSGLSAILIEASSGTVIFEKDADSKRQMASTTKIMTALLALECDTSRVVTVTDESVGVEGSSIYLKVGDKITLEDLVWALLLESANDAATAIAVEVAGSVDAFAEMMNKKAEELGLCDTNFTNPHGLSHENHYTTARDLAKLAAYALKVPKFYEIVSTYRHSITVGCESRSLLNHNKMLKNYDGAVGVKTGYTKNSGRCLVSAAERDGVRLVAVTLNAPDDWNDHRVMLDYGFATVESREIIKPGQSTFILPCIGCESRQITVSNPDGLTLCLFKDMPNINWTVELPHYLWAPVEKGETVGRIVFDINGEKLGEVQLKACENAERIIYKKKLF